MGKAWRGLASTLGGVGAADTPRSGCGRVFSLVSRSATFVVLITSVSIKEQSLL